MTPEVVEGPFADTYTQLLQTLQTNEDALEGTKLDGEAELRTPAINFPYFAASGESLQARVFVGVDKKGFKNKESDLPLLLAVDPDTSDSALSRFQLMPDGVLTNVDNTEQDVEDMPDMKALLKKTVEQLESQLSFDHQAHLDRRHTIRNRTAGTVATLGVLSFVAAGVYAGLEHWKFGPERQRAAERHAYDTERHELPGQAIAAPVAKAASMPAIDFSKIPAIHKGDTLFNPRTVDVTGNDCTSVSAGLPAGYEIVAALPEDDPLRGTNYSVAVKGTHELEICLSGLGSSVDDTTSKLAVQVVRYPDARNN